MTPNHSEQARKCFEQMCNKFDYWPPNEGPFLTVIQRHLDAYHESKAKELVNGLDAVLEACRQVNKAAIGNFYLPETREGALQLGKSYVEAMNNTATKEKL
jgi:hypothetical protein